MASLVANDVNAVVVDVTASPSRVAVTRSAADAVAPAHVALPARSATSVRLAGLAVLCAATLVAPALLLVWMPIVLGVPHIASDIRFLILPLPRRQVIVSLGACAALVALKASSLVFGVPLLQAEAIVVAVWLLAMLSLAQSSRRSHVLARHAQIETPRSVHAPHAQIETRHPRHAAHGRYARSARTSAVWIVAAFGAFAIIALPIQFAIIAAMAHNFIAVVAWIVVKRPARAQLLAVIATITAAVTVLIIAGPALATMTGGATSPWLTIDKAASMMFGGIPLPTARGLMIAFAFLQAVHYAIWLDWVPRGTARMPTKPWLLVVAATLVVVGAALVNPAWARTTYLALATFHIYLEIVVLSARAARRYA